MCVHSAPFSFEFIFNQFFLSFSAAQYIQSKHGFLLTRHKYLLWHCQCSEESKNIFIKITMKMNVPGEKMYVDGIPAVCKIM